MRQETIMTGEDAGSAVWVVPFSGLSADERARVTVLAVIRASRALGEEDLQPVYADYGYMVTCDRSDPRDTEMFPDMARAALDTLASLGLSDIMWRDANGDPEMIIGPRAYITEIEDGEGTAN